MSDVDDLYMARVFLVQAKALRQAGRNHGFYWTLLEWAANRRRSAMKQIKQHELFEAAA